MAEVPTETISRTEKIYDELSKMRCEGLFCRRCACYCATKDEFSKHLQEHLNETNSGKENYMSYVEKYICSKCGKQFEVKSDLIIHYNTVCIDALYTCKHCRENCETSPFLQMHLVVHHNYSEEMLRDEGFLTDLDYNPFFSESSFMTSFKRKAFKSPTPEVGKNIYNVGSSVLVQATYSWKYRTSQKSANERQNLAFNFLNKAHACEICYESFSRKCVLEIHRQKHFSKTTKKKKGIPEIPEKGLDIKVSETNGILTRNSKKNATNIDTKVVELTSNAQKAILKPSNVVFNSSVWKKINPKRKLRGVKRCVSTINDDPKIKRSRNSKTATPNANKTNAVSQLSSKVSAPSKWKKIKLKSKIRKAVVSHQKGSGKLIKTRQSKSSETKQCKETPKNEVKQAFTCEVCKKNFKDGYKLRRHSLVHTGIRPYTCTTCKKTFARDDHLKRHIKRVCSKTAKSPPNV